MNLDDSGPETATVRWRRLVWVIIGSVLFAGLGTVTAGECRISAEDALLVPHYWAVLTEEGDAVRVIGLFRSDGRRRHVVSPAHQDLEGLDHIDEDDLCVESLPAPCLRWLREVCEAPAKTKSRYRLVCVVDAVGEYTSERERKRCPAGRMRIDRIVAVVPVIQELPTTNRE